MVKKGDSYEFKTNSNFEWDHWYKTNWVDVRLPESGVYPSYPRESRLASIRRILLGWLGQPQTGFEGRSRLCGHRSSRGATDEDVKAMNIAVQIIAPGTTSPSRRR